MAHLSRSSLGTVSPYGEHLAHLAGHEPRQLVLAALQNLSSAQDDVATVGPGGAPPVVERLMPGAYGVVDVLRIALRKHPDDVVAVGWVSRSKRASAV